MLYEVLATTDFVFWAIILVDLLILSAMKSGPRIGTMVASVIIVGLFTDAFSALQLAPDLRTLLNILGYFGIGLVTFCVMFFVNIVLVKKDLKDFATEHGLSVSDMRTVLQSNPRFGRSAGGPMLDQDLYDRYHFEPSWAGFYDRLFCWPAAIPGWLFGDFLRSVAKTVAIKLVKFRKSFIGYE